MRLNQYILDWVHFFFFLNSMDAFTKRSFIFDAQPFKYSAIQSKHFLCVCFFSSFACIPSSSSCFLTVLMKQRHGSLHLLFKIDGLVTVSAFQMMIIMYIQIVTLY